MDYKKEYEILDACLEIQKGKIEKLKQENAELKAKIKKYAELNEIDTRDYAALHNENIKLNAIIDGYQPRLQALKDDNERLKEEIKEVKKYQYEQEYLDKEIEEMQKALKTLAEGLNKRQILLQEIKEICKNSHTSASEDYYRTADKIIQKITKAEEEWK